MLKYNVEDKGPSWLLLKQEKTKGKENSWKFESKLRKKTNSIKRMVQQLDISLCVYFFTMIAKQIQTEVTITRSTLQ
jgi:hypothetical protein